MRFDCDFSPLNCVIIPRDLTGFFSCQHYYTAQFNCFLLVTLITERGLTVLFSLHYHTTRFNCSLLIVIIIRFMCSFLFINIMPQAFTLLFVSTLSNFCFKYFFRLRNHIGKQNNCSFLFDEMKLKLYVRHLALSYRKRFYFSLTMTEMYLSHTSIPFT